MVPGRVVPTAMVGPGRLHGAARRRGSEAARARRECASAESRSHAPVDWCIAQGRAHPVGRSGQFEPPARTGRIGTGPARSGMTKLTHLDGSGRAQMVDVGEKQETARAALAEGIITMSAEAFDLVRKHGGSKGEVLATAELAGTMGAKRTADLIPLCHPLGLDHVDVKATLDPALPGVRIEASTRATGR